MSAPARAGLGSPEIDEAAKDEVKRFRQSVHLMIDELDLPLQASTKEVPEVNDLIRHLYDLCPNCFGLVLAVSAEQEIRPSIFTEYVLTRVSRQIEFKPFDRAAAVEFSTQVMDNSRDDDTDAARKGAFSVHRGYIGGGAWLAHVPHTAESRECHAASDRRSSARGSGSVAKCNYRGAT